MRRLAFVVSLLACSASDRTPHQPAAGAPLVSPGLRLPDDAAPIAYDLELDLDPEKETFTGHVAIKTRILTATDHVWLSADRLRLGAASWTGAGGTGGSLSLDPAQGDEMRAFRFGRRVEPGEVVLDIAFTGSLDRDQEGLFRQRAPGGGWYIFSQGESVFARRFTPCFDEPRFKTPWRVTLTVPKSDVALANMPETTTRAIDAQRKQVAFAQSAPMPSYLVALAVGPFDVVDVGPMGRGKLVVRVAVRHGEGKHVGVVAAKLPAVVNAIEKYVDDPLPLAKLDLVVVPHLFGAMENPGLITFDEAMIVGDVRESLTDNFVLVAAHELAHQWFGNSVTPAWWDDLWLSEGFASWLGNRIELQLGSVADPELRAALTRREAIAADSGSSAAPLRRPMLHNADPDNSFDEIAYQKAQVVLSSFEDYLGEPTFRAVLRDYLKAHAGGTATTTDFVAALRKVANNDDVATSFDQYVRSTGVPVIELTKDCSHRKPLVIAHARDHRIVPVCVANELERSAESCQLVGERAEFAIGASCTPTLGNAHAAYYHHVWTNGSALGPEAELRHHRSKIDIAIGDNVAAMIERGELDAADAIAELKKMLDAGDPYVAFGGVAIARAIDQLVGEDQRAAWSAWLAKHAQGLHATPAAKPNPTAPGPSVELADELDRARLELAPSSFTAVTVKEAHVALDKELASFDLTLALVAIAAPSGGDKLFARIAERAKLAPASAREDFYEALGLFGPAQAPAAVALLGDASIEIDRAWLAVSGMLDRPATRDAAWRALKPLLPAVVKRMGPESAGDLVEALGSLCDKTSRDQIVTNIEPLTASIEDGKSHLATALAAIDRCIASRSKLGDLAGALAR